MLSATFSQHARLIAQQQGRQVPAAAGCITECGDSDVVRRAQRWSRVDLGGVSARVRGVRPAMWDSCQRADCRRTSEELRVNRHLALGGTNGYHARGGGG